MSEHSEGTAALESGEAVDEAGLGDAAAKNDDGADFIDQEGNL